MPVIYVLVEIQKVTGLASRMRALQMITLLLLFFFLGFSQAPSNLTINATVC